MKLLLVDGHYYLYRSFFAIRELRNSRGEPTNAVYAFAKAIRKMVMDVRPTHGAVIWDAGIPARRMELQPAYKQQRPEMPDDLQKQEDPVRELCPLLGLQSLHLPRTEADDLIASYVRQAPTDTECIIATSDKDIYQLVGPCVRIYSTSKADLGGEEGSTAFALLGPEEVERKWGVPPAAIGDVLSLTGDTSDNIPGVPGVGPKTASSLIRQFGSLDHLLQNLEQISRPALKEKLAACIDLIHANREMVRLDEDLLLPVQSSSLQLSPDHAGLVSFFQKMEFRSLLEEAKEEARKAGIDCKAPARGASAAVEQGELF